MNAAQHAEDSNIVDLPSVNPNPPTADATKIRWTEFQWKSSAAMIRHVVTVMMTAGDYNHEDWENKLRGKADEHYKDKNATTKQSLEHTATVKAQEYQSAKAQAAVAQWKLDEPTLKKYDEDHDGGRLSTPKGLDLVVAVVLALLLVGLIAWTLLNTSTLILSRAQNYAKAMLIVCPLALCPVLVKLVVDRIPSKLRSRAYGVLAGISGIAFIGWVVCLGQNYVRPVDLNALLVGGVQESNSRGLQLGCQIALEVSLGALLFRQLSEKFLSPYSDAYLQAQKAMEQANQQEAAAANELALAKQIVASWEPARQAFVNKCVSVGATQRQILAIGKSNLEELKQQLEKGIES